MSAEPQASAPDLAMADIARLWWTEWKRVSAALIRGILPEDGRELIAAQRGSTFEIVWHDGESGRVVGTEPGRTFPAAEIPVRDVILQLAPDDVLRSSLRLPYARAHVLLKALQFEIEHISPLPANEIYFDFRVVARDRAEKAAEFEVRIVRRRIVDALAAQCRSAGLAVSGIRFADGLAAGAGTFPVDTGARLKSRWRRSKLRVFAAAIPLLAAALLLALYLRGEQVLDTLGDRVANDSVAAARVEQLRGRIERATQQLRFLGEQKRAPLFAAVLAEVTHTLPDGSWLTQLDVSGNKIRIEGYSRAAADLIAAFDRSPYFANAQFAAPVTQGSAPGIERFDLSVELAGAHK
ncbi:MAG: PilN domain-containing protein [Alphaproteobacteria bacterium]|nr:PilN domain-containing protein [Alphaproteobacteria bacterium]MBV9693545.1 PilN domain-containing protein [Alphaproteobacteria bacterium]